MPKKMNYYETFKPDSNCWNMLNTGDYFRNDEKCRGKIVYCDNNSFYIIEKTNAPWDKDSNGKSLSTTYSVCWKIAEGVYALGLSNDNQFITNFTKLLP